MTPSEEERLKKALREVSAWKPPPDQAEAERAARRALREVHVSRAGWGERGNWARELGRYWSHFRDPEDWPFAQWYWAILLGAPFYALGGWTLAGLTWPFRRLGRLFKRALDESARRKRGK